MRSLLFYYLFNPDRKPKKRFVVNVSIFFVFITFLYIVRYSVGIQADLIVSGTYSEEALKNGRIISAIKFYAIVLIYAFWQYNKWIKNGEINFLKKQKVFCDCGKQYNGGRAQCPKCGTSNFLMEDSLYGNTSPTAVSQEETEKEKNRDKIDPNTASFKTNKMVRMEAYIRKI